MIETHGREHVSLFGAHARAAAAPRRATRGAERTHAAMKLYYSPMSSNSRRARIAALMLGIELELVNVDLFRAEHRKPEFLAKNPMGKIPLLEDGDFALPESNAIMAYLADSRPDQALYPRELRARAEVNRWLFWAASHWSPVISALAMENFLKAAFGTGERDAAQVARQEALFHDLARVLDAHLATGRQWVAADHPTIADIAIGTSLMNAVPAKLPLEPYANVRALFARVQALDAWKQTEPPPRPAR